MTGNHVNPETEEVNAYKARNAVVRIPASEFRLPDVLRHIEEGKIVIVTPAPRETDLPGAEKKKTPRGRTSGHGAFYVPARRKCAAGSKVRLQGQ